MSDELARIVGAGDTIKVGDKTYVASPLSLSQLQELQKAALRYYQDQYMEAFANGLKYLDNGSKDEKIVEESRRVAEWTINNLPKQAVYDPDDIEMTSELREWAKDTYDLSEEESLTPSVRKLIVASIQEKRLSLDELKRLSGKSIRANYIAYDFHWITSNFDGLCEFVFSSLRKKNKRLSLQDIKNWEPKVLLEAGSLVESVVAPAMGNM